MILNKEEKEILAHSLGVDLSQKKPIQRFYRNYFCASNEHNDYKTLCSLEQKELVFRYEKFGVQMFSVTEKGKQIFSH